MLYGEKLKEICEKVGVEADKLPDRLYSTLLNAICDCCGPASGGDNPIVTEDITITPTTSVQTKTRSSGKYINKVTVNAIQTEEKTVTENGEVTPTSGKFFSKVTVNVPSTGITPTGTIEISTNGTHDVTNYASANVNVPSKEPVLQEKTVTANGDVTPDDGYDGLSKVVVNVASSGGGSGEIGTGNYYLKVIDYDGTILDEKRLNNGDTYTLPNAPSHDGLVFQEWSCSQEIVDGVITIANNNVMVGATYTTESGLSEFDITLTKKTGLSVTLKMNGTKNWGDGTSDDLTTHTYTEYGDYTITCNGTTMTTNSSSGLFGQTSSAINYYCTSARFGVSVTSISNYAFQYCYSLASIVTPKGVTSVGGSSFQYCYSLASIVIPMGVISIVSNNFQYCNSLQSIVVPKGVTSVGDNAFQYCYSLTSVVIPNSITSGTFFTTFQNCSSLMSMVIPNGVSNINNNTFRYCYSITKYDFTQHTKIPAGSTSAFTGINALCKIYVPDELYDEWIAANNWSTYADYIYKASEMTE